MKLISLEENVSYPTYLNGRTVIFLSAHLSFLENQCPYPCPGKASYKLKDPNQLIPTL